MTAPRAWCTSYALGLPATCAHQLLPSLPEAIANLFLLPGQGLAGLSSLLEVPMDLREVALVKLCDEIPLLRCHLLYQNQQHGHSNTDLPVAQRFDA